MRVGRSKWEESGQQCQILPETPFLTVSSKMASAPAPSLTLQE